MQSFLCVGVLALRDCRQIVVNFNRFQAILICIFCLEKFCCFWIRKYHFLLKPSSLNLNHMYIKHCLKNRCFKINHNLEKVSYKMMNFKERNTVLETIKFRSTTVIKRVKNLFLVYKSTVNCKKWEALISVFQFTWKLEDSFVIHRRPCNWCQNI